MTVQSPQGTPPPPYTPAPPAKKGMGPLGWVAIGCGVIVILCAIVAGGIAWFAKRQVDKFADNPGMAAAEMIVKMNPDLELVESDRDAGTLTVRDKKTGEEMTVNMEDAKNGNFEFKTDKGTTKIEAGGGAVKMTDDKGQESTFGVGSGKLPSWLPAYPGGTSQGAYDANTAEGHTGTVTVTTTDTLDQVADFYETELKGAGLKVQKNIMQSDGATSAGTVSGTSDDEKRTVTIILSPGEGGGAQAMITFNEKP